MTQLSLGRHGGVWLCARCIRQQSFKIRIRDRRTSSEPCTLCGRIDALTSTPRTRELSLTTRILSLIAVGLSSREVAERLNLPSGDAVRKRMERERDQD